jgi:hypothetical protein
MRPSRRDHYVAPATGPDTHAALDAAIDSLAAARGLDTGDPATAVHLLASLSAEASTRSAQAISDARRYGCSWAEIADLLGVTRASAWQRWAEHDPTPAEAQRQRSARPAATPPPRGSNERRQDRR